MISSITTALYISINADFILLDAQDKNLGTYFVPHQNFNLKANPLGFTCEHIWNLTISSHLYGYHPRQNQHYLSHGLLQPSSNWSSYFHLCPFSICSQTTGRVIILKYNSYHIILSSKPSHNSHQTQSKCPNPLTSHLYGQVASYQSLTHSAKLHWSLAILQAYQVLSQPRNCLCSNICLEFFFLDIVLLPS